MATDVTELKQRQRKAWSAGDYPDIAHTIEGEADVLVERSGVEPGDEVLDVATGTGNVALRQARSGAARVVGLDFVPELLDVARTRAAHAGVSIEWVEGDAEELPFGDASFDRVTSCFGVMFAPDHRASADELMRVCRPGGTVAFTAWTPQGLHGRLFGTIASMLPPPPPGVQPPPLWGVEDHVRGLFGAHSDDIDFTRGTSPIDAESADAWIAYLERVLGPVVMAKAALEPQGRWDELRTNLVELYQQFDTGSPGAFHADAEYLMTVVRKPG